VSIDRGDYSADAVCSQIAATAHDAASTCVPPSFVAVPALDTLTETEAEAETEIETGADDLEDELDSASKDAFTTLRIGDRRTVLQGGCSDDDDEQSQLARYAVDIITHVCQVEYQTAIRSGDYETERHLHLLWILSACNNCRVDGIAFIACQIYDSFMATRPPGITPSDLRIVRVTCLYIAGKYECIMPPCLADLLPSSCYLHQPYYDMELKILCALGFRVKSELCLDRVCNALITAFHISLPATKQEQFGEHLVACLVNQHLLQTYPVTLIACSLLSLYVDETLQANMRQLTVHDLDATRVCLLDIQHVCEQLPNSKKYGIISSRYITFHNK
jgi:hypothetical protein